MPKVDLQSQVNQNTADITTIKHNIDTILNNHLAHMEADMEKQSRLVEKIDSRMFWVLGILVVSTVISMIGN